MDKFKEKQMKKARTHNRVRVKIKGTAKRPRLSVFRSNRDLYVQLIDDDSGRTLASASSREAEPNKDKNKNRKINIGFEVGKIIADKAKGKKIDNVVFDRGGNKYHGRVKAVAEGARKNGLVF